MFYVGAIDERLNDKGYIVPGYDTRWIMSNRSRLELEILVIDYLELESWPERSAPVDRIASRKIELMSTTNSNTFRDRSIYISSVLQRRLPVYFSKHKIHGTDDGDNVG